MARLNDTKPWRLTLKVFVCDADTWIDECGLYSSDGLLFGEFDEKCLYSNLFLFDFLTNLFTIQDIEISRHKFYKYLALLSGKNSWEISFVILRSYGNLLFFWEGCWGYIKHTMQVDLFWYVVRILYNTTWLIKKSQLNCINRIVLKCAVCLSASLDIWGLWYAFCGSWKILYLLYTEKKSSSSKYITSPAFVFLGVKNDSWEFRIFQNTLFHLQPLRLFSVLGVSKYVFDETIEYYVDCSRKFSWLWLQANSHTFTVCSEINFLTSQKCSLTYCFCIMPSMKVCIFGYCVNVLFSCLISGVV